MAERSIPASNRARTLPRIVETGAATGTIATVGVNWADRDAADRPRYDCDFHPVVRIDGNGDLRIRVVSAINEASRPAAFLGGR